MSVSPERLRFGAGLGRREAQKILEPRNAHRRAFRRFFFGGGLNRGQSPAGKFAMPHYRI